MAEMTFSFLSKAENCSNKCILITAFCGLVFLNQCKHSSAMHGLREFFKLLYLFTSIGWRRVALATTRKIEMRLASLLTDKLNGS